MAKCGPRSERGLKSQFSFKQLMKNSELIHFAILILKESICIGYGLEVKFEARNLGWGIRCRS